MVDAIRSAQYKKQFFGDAKPRKFRWHSAGDEQVCPVCERFDGREFDMENFDSMYPAHDGCRCTLEPVFVVDLSEAIRELEAKKAQAKLQKKKPFWKR